MESVAVIVDSQIVEDAVKGEMSRLYPASEVEAGDTSSAWRPLCHLLATLPTVAPK